MNCSQNCTYFMAPASPVAVSIQDRTFAWEKVIKFHKLDQHVMYEANLKSSSTFMN